MSAPAPRIAIIAGEASGDRLGGALMTEIRRRAPDSVFIGVGGEDMTDAGLSPLFPMSEIALMGVFAIAKRLPSLLRRISETVAAIVAADPDVLVIIDCPEFSHRVARRVRARAPGLAVVDYVAPSVWAWRPGRARAMRAYVDDILALLPFEPEAFARLGGPRCHYVGHPAIERPAPETAVLNALDLRLAGADPVLAVLPGSRFNEITRLVGPFGEAVARLRADIPGLGVVIPALANTSDWIAAAVAGWDPAPVIVTDEADRHAAIVRADAALVASGTATLELALAGTPMVVGYRMERFYSVIRRFLPVHSIVLANLIHGGNPIPELFQGACTGDRLADTVRPLLTDTPARRAQMDALAEIGARLADIDKPPSVAATDIVLDAVARTRAARAGTASA